MDADKDFYRPSPARSVPRAFLKGEVIGRRISLTPGWETFFPGSRQLISEDVDNDARLDRRVRWSIQSFGAGILYCSIFEASAAELARLGYCFPLSAPKVLVTIEQHYGDIGAAGLSSAVLRRLHIHGVAAEFTFSQLASPTGAKSDG